MWNDVAVGPTSNQNRRSPTFAVNGVVVLVGDAVEHHQVGCSAITVSAFTSDASSAEDAIRRTPRLHQHVAVIDLGQVWLDDHSLCIPATMAVIGWVEQWYIQIPERSAVKRYTNDSPGGIVLIG